MIRLTHLGPLFIRNGKQYRLYTVRLKYPDGTRKDFPSEEHARAFLENRKPNFTPFETD